MEYNVLPRKESIVLTAIDLIDEFGIMELSTKEIAKRQGISEAAVFKHFKSKKELILEVIKYFSKFDNEIIQTIKLRNMNPKDAIYYFINSYVEYYENYPAITSMIYACDVLTYDIELAPSLNNVFNVRRLILKELIESANTLGELKTKPNSDNLADIISGMINSVCRRWRLENKVFSLKTSVMESLGIILQNL